MKTIARLGLIGVAVASSVADARAEPAPAAADAAQVPAVIERGQEDLLAEMLGRGAPLPGDCKWAGATVEQTRVLSFYDCAGRRVDVELRHPDDAAVASARSERFAFVERGAAAPPGLLDALVARFRAREAAFRWKRVTSSPLALPSRDDRPLRALAIALAVAAALSVPMRFAYVRLARRGPKPPATRAGAIAGAAVAVALAVGTCAALRASTLAYGQAALAMLGPTRRGVASSLGAMIAWIVPALGAAVLSARVPARLSSRARFALGAVLYFAATYPPTLRPEDDWPRFGAVVPGPRSRTSWDDTPGRPPMTYRFDSFGFRERDFSVEKAAGTTRIALLGDSYVQGVGVDVPDTLGENLAAELARRAPERRFEVLNLGIPGDNLSSHVDLYEATERLSPDLVVLCLTLPNDLSRWDVQQRRRASERPGAFSFARWLVGDAAGPFWDTALLEMTITPAGLAHLEREVARLSRLRAAEPHPPRLVVFSYRELGQAIASRLAPLVGARIVPEVAIDGDDFFRGDGHPTGAGNRKFARAIADAIQAELLAGR